MHDESPYSGLVRALASPAAPGGWHLGEVITAQPLAVDIGGITAQGKSLWVNELLLAPPVEAAVRLPGYDIAESNGTITPKEPFLHPGDRVLLLTDDDQVFYLMCKVVGT